MRLSRPDTIPRLKSSDRATHGFNFAHSREVPAAAKTSPSKFRLGDFGPSFAEHLKSSKTAPVECLQIRRIAVIKLLKDIVHHLNPHNDPDLELEEAARDVKSHRAGKRKLRW